MYTVYLCLVLESRKRSLDILTKLTTLIAVAEYFSLMTLLLSDNKHYVGCY